MPLVVPILRLAMLFLNIYDSYKVLKPPPPSPRHANRPSLRAITQRKRNLKGCLSIWIVWCCFTLYERLFEVIVSLFIPFYDEMKSLVIIFLMLTRSRGAEPIYLHIIRPFLKPYTETLDSVLDFMFVIGDIALATIFAPMNAILGIWKRMFGRGDKPSDNIQMDHDTYPSTGDQIHEHISTESPSRELPIPRSQIPRPMEIHRTDSGSSSRFMPKENNRPYTPPSQDENSDATRKHEIWYPPPSSYQDDDEDIDEVPRPQRTATSSSMDSEVTLVTVEQVDEWRQYPRFPAAYPPTPVVTITRLAPKSAPLGIDSSLPKIDEVSKQGFQQSLSTPPETTNPDSDGDLSDEKLDPGVREVIMEDDDRTATPDNHDVSMADSSFVDEDEEDEFNITLQTPILTRAIIKPMFHDSKMTSRTTSLATTSVRSLSTGLSTVENGSSLRTRTSLDSLSSTAMSSGEDLPVVGKKRPLRTSKSTSGRNTNIVSSGLDSEIVNDARGDKRHGLGHAPIMRPSNQQRNQGDGRTTSEVKKRRVTSPNKIAVRTSKLVRHARPRFARPASPPARSQRFQRKPVSGQTNTLSKTRTHGVPALQLNDAAAPSGKSGPRRAPALRAAERKFDEDS